LRGPLHEDEIAGRPPRSATKRLSVDADPVAAHLWPLLVSVPVGDDRVGREVRHVAVDAMADDRLPLLPVQAAALWRVTAHAAAGERHEITLLRMYIVAGPARHPRLQEAGASRQQLELIAVNVDVVLQRGRRNVEMALERGAGHVRERGGPQHSETRVA